ncbi:polysaccharide pyruvyl transferase family protein [Neobacillus drentensis]|uniref:polysaccharide pyruvyl transferase family protein n=1 Tax=Neobacillus drentensis TaxID=220684 RepID=UPI00300196A5
MKRIFVDIYLAFNLGDDLFLDILSKKYPNCEFTINYVGKNYDEFISQYGNVNRRRYTIFNKVGQRLKITNYLTNYEKVAEEHDGLIFIGGSIFREEEYHQSLYKDRMAMVREFKDRSKPVFVLGANFGPYQTIEFFNHYMEFFKQCDDVCFRDLYSYKLFENLPQVRYAPDIVFQMNIDEYRIKSNKMKIGFSIIDLRHKHGLTKFFDDYINSTVKSIELLINKGYECCLMSFCEEEGDLQVANIIKSNLSIAFQKNVSIYEYNGNIKEAISLISNFELFIAARFHANIIGLLLGIGIMPLIYSKKTTNMLKDIKLDRILVTMEELNLQYDESTLKKSLNNKTKLGLITKEAENQFLKLDLFLEE